MKNNIFYTERTDKGAIDVYSTAAGVLTSDYNAVVDRPRSCPPPPPCS